MAASSYAYTGGSEMWYQDYLDMATGKMLAALPGESYTMFAVNPGLPIPPSDGRWQETAPPPPPVKAAAPAPAPAPAAPAPEGGDN